LIQPYHFIDCRPTGFIPFYQRIIAANGVACFDFEDSIGADEADEATTVALKQAQRHQVGQLLTTTPQLDFNLLAVRINAPDTAHYAADLAALRGLPGLHAVFVPKVEAPETLRQVLQELPLPVRHVVAVVETAAAFDNLPALLSLPDPQLNLVAFGHCDYNLSCGHFPFFHHDAPQYWAWLAELDRHAQATSKRLLNSPVLRLADDAHFRAVRQQLRQYPSIIGQITLCLAQTELCAQPAAASALLPLLPAPDAAEQLTAQFEQGQLAGRTFALNAGRRLISPHEYAAARQYAL
jgi:citrate lyase beta subunit